jgi:hypothetical protein
LGDLLADRIGGSGQGTSVTVKALPSGSRNQNMAGPAGQRRISPAAVRAAWALPASPVLNRMPVAPRVRSGAAGSGVMMTLA